MYSLSTTSSERVDHPVCKFRRIFCWFFNSRDLRQVPTCQHVDHSPRSENGERRLGMLLKKYYHHQQVLFSAEHLRSSCIFVYRLPLENNSINHCCWSQKQRRRRFRSNNKVKTICITRCRGRVTCIAQINITIQCDNYRYYVSSACHHLPVYSLSILANWAQVEDI